MPRDKTRLCIVNPFQYGGGAEYQIGCLLDVLIPVRDCEIYYLAHHTDARGDREGCRIVKIGRGNEAPRFGYMTDSVPLYQALAGIAPDVIYQRVGCGYTGVCAFYARRHDVRMIWHVAHDTDVTPGAGIYGRNPLRGWLEKRSVEYGARHAQLIVTQTAFQAGLLQTNYGRTATAVVPNFQPPPGERLDKSGPITVVWVANFKRWKRPEVFIRLAARLQDLAGVRFVMAGEGAAGGGDREWGAELAAAIESTPNLTHLGRRSQQEVNELLATSHVLVNTSEAEGFANTFIQAWMREMPVVSLDVDPDGILERESVGIHAGSEERLADAVRRLVTDPSLRNDTAARARQYAMKHHSLRNAQSLAQLIRTGRIGE